MVAAQLGRPVGAFPNRTGSANTGQRHFLDELVRCQHGNAQRDIRKRPGEDQGNAAAVTVADQQRAFNMQCCDQGRE